MNDTFWRIIVIVSGYIVTLLFSGNVVSCLIKKNNVQTGELEKDNLSEKNDSQRIRTGRIIGKCENILTLTFILANEFTCLALIFAAKSIVRIEDIKKNPLYFLGGTMVNFTFSVIMAFLIKLTITYFIANRLAAL